MNEGINVLSLFDGMSCGRIALDRIGIKVNKYYASEIDKFAMKVSKENWDDITQLGDVNLIKQWYEDNEKPSIDLMLMGSPCQGFSNASKDKLNFEHPQSKLFFVAVEIMKLVKPKYFLLENVKMKKEWQDIISSYMGVEPIKINSALVSAQSRNRLYWTNIPNVSEPKDKGIVLKDILDDNLEFSETYSNYLNSSWGDKKKTSMVKSTEDKKSHCLTASMWKGQIPTWIKKPIRIGTADTINGHDILKRVYSIEGKSPTLNTCSGGNREPKIIDVNATREVRTEEGKRIRRENKKLGRDYNPFRAKKTVIKEDGKSNALIPSSVYSTNKIRIQDEEKFVWRKLSATECEALQTVPRNYTQSVSNTQRLKMLGNGWTVDVICHILKNINQNQKEENHEND
tara:strand:- start:12386 stop:13585 length:1200 start_codon:yes stop_codon:yes gene_type:complete